MNLLLIAIAIVPVILILTFVHSKDKNKEPIGLLVGLFFAGVLSCFLVILISLVLSEVLPFMQLDTSNPNNSFLDIFLYSFVGVALIEETCKFLMTYTFSYRHRAFDEVYDMLVYAIFVALGFACYENIMYVIGSGAISTGILRGLTAVPGHACDGLFMGYYLSLAKIASLNKDKYEERINIAKSIFIPTVLHGIYDFCCFYGNQYIIIVFIIFVIAMYIVALRKLNVVAKNNQNIYQKKPKLVEVVDPSSITQTTDDAQNKDQKAPSFTPPTNQNKNKSDYFTIMPSQPRPFNDNKTENFKFENQTVPYVPDLIPDQVLTDAPIISQNQSAGYVQVVKEEEPIPIPEIPQEKLASQAKRHCVYCGAELYGEYCSSCGHKDIQ